MKITIITFWVSLLFICLLSNNRLHAQCNASTYSTSAKDSWLSCETSMNPNISRGNSHWLQYDLGYFYELGPTKFWNYNVTNLTGNGFKQVAIDYSLDGITWTEAGTFQLPEADGDSNYDGVAGVDLAGIQARYVLITAISNWNGEPCAGLSEVRFEINESSGSCGDFIVTQNISDDPIQSGTHYGDNPIIADGKVKNEANVIFKSPMTITLKAGFTVEAGSQFLAKIENCNSIKSQAEIPNQDRQSNSLAKPKNNIAKTIVKIYPNPTVDVLSVELDKTAITSLMIINSSGHEILRRNSIENFNQIDVSQLVSGMYLLCALTTNQELITQRFIKTGL